MCSFPLGNGESKSARCQWRVIPRGAVNCFSRNAFIKWKRHGQQAWALAPQGMWSRFWWRFWCTWFGFGAPRLDANRAVTRGAVILRWTIGQFERYLLLVLVGGKIRCHSTVLITQRSEIARLPWFDFTRITNPLAKAVVFGRVQCLCTML